MPKTKQRSYSVIFMERNRPSHSSDRLMTCTLYEYFEGIRKMNENLYGGVVYQPSRAALDELKELENAAS